MSNIAGYILQNAQAQLGAIAMIDHSLARYQKSRSRHLDQYGYSLKEVSYQTFTNRFSRLAAGIRALDGICPKDRIIICMENRPEYLDILLACWCAGLCVVPVNAKLHAKEILHIVSDSAARLVLVDEAYAEELGQLFIEAHSHVHVLIAGSPDYANLYDAQPMACVDVQADDLAWIFYTSGTTGRPKGAMLSHHNLLMMSLIYCADIEQVSPGDVQFHAAPLSHGAGLYSIPHLLGGGTQVIFDGFDPQKMLDALDCYQNVTFFAAPTMVMRLVNFIQPGQQFPGLRTIIYGGGPMYVNDLLRALDCFGPKLYQLYGQGESPMTITGLSKIDHQGNRDPTHLARLATCGPVRTAVQVRVVDEDGLDLLIGQIGEIITRSQTVMQGYWNNSEATTQVIRDGWLWTGDVGYLEESGYLCLRDRSKDLIISGGSNIYPREIEEVLLRHASVLECSVIGQLHPEWGEEVVAFIVLKPGFDLNIDALDEICLANIARFKRPKVYRLVDSLPKNNYGKVLKTVLRKILQQDKNHA